MLHSHSMNNILNINCLSLSLIAEVRMNVLSNLITVVKMFVFSCSAGGKDHVTDVTRCVSHPIFLCIQLVDLCTCHGRLVEPPSRTSAWRLGHATPTYYNDSETNCGGYDRHHNQDTAVTLLLPLPKLTFNH